MPEGFGGLDTFLSILQALSPGVIGTAVGLGRTGRQRKGILRELSRQGAGGRRVRQGAQQGFARAGLRGPAAAAGVNEALQRFELALTPQRIQTLQSLMGAQAGQVRQGQQDVTSQIGLILRLLGGGGGAGVGGGIFGGGGGGGGILG